MSKLKCYAMQKYSSFLVMGFIVLLCSYAHAMDVGMQQQLVLGIADAQQKLVLIHHQLQELSPDDSRRVRLETQQSKIWESLNSLNSYGDPCVEHALENIFSGQSVVPLQDSITYHTQIYSEQQFLVQQAYVHYNGNPYKCRRI